MEKVTRDVFDLWIEHGVRPLHAGYAYVLLPGATAEQTADRAAHPDVEVLAQTDKVHAVRQAKLGIRAVAFFEAGAVGNIEVDRACLVMVRGRRLSVCDPENKSGTIRVTVDGRVYAVDLPAGEMAGSTVTVAL